MLITTNKVIGYTEFDSVKNRDIDKIEKDILQAETEIFNICNHKFTDEKYATLPEEVSLAITKLAEYYALVNSDESLVKGYKSENIEGYSYTLGDTTTRVKKPDIYNLIKSYIVDEEVKTETVRFRMRSL